MELIKLLCFGNANVCFPKKSIESGETARESVREREPSAWYSHLLACIKIKESSLLFPHCILCIYIVKYVNCNARVIQCWLWGNYCLLWGFIRYQYRHEQSGKRKSKQRYGGWVEWQRCRRGGLISTLPGALQGCPRLFRASTHILSN